MAGASPPTALVDPRNVPVPSSASTPDVEMHGPSAMPSTFVDARTLNMMQQNVEVSYAGEAHAAAGAMRLAAELRFREYEEDFARNQVNAEMLEHRQVADAAHEGRISALANRFTEFADGMRSELRATQEALETRTHESLMAERHTEHLIARLVEMSERSDRQNEEMLAMREAFETNRSETISFLSSKFRDELSVHQAEHQRILTREEVEFDSLIQDLSEENAELQRRLGEAVRSSGDQRDNARPEGSAPQGAASTKERSPASLRTEITGALREDLPDPFKVPDEMKELFAGPVFPLNSGDTTPQEGHATSSKDVPVAAPMNSSPENLLLKALQSMMSRGDEDGKPKAKEEESIKLLEFPTPETYRSWRIAAREAIRSASDRPDEAFVWVQAVYSKDQTLEGLKDPGKFLTLDAKLLSAISKVVKGELARQIVTYKEAEAAKGRAVRGRQVLWMFEQYFKTNEEVGALYSVEDLLKVSLINDDLSAFTHNWESVIAGISHVPEELTLRDILLRQIRGSHRLKYDLETYDRAKEGTETHSYQFLLTSIKNLLTRERVRKNREKIAKSHGAKYGAPAPEDGKGKGKGGRKGRDSSRPRGSSQVPKGFCFTWLTPANVKKATTASTNKHEKPRSKSPSRGRSNSPRDLSKVPCKFHKIGRCNAGANCRFSRDKTPPASPAKGDKPRAPSPAKRRRSKSRNKHFAAAARKGEPTLADHWEQS